MKDTIVRSRDEIDEVLNWASEALENGPHYPGQSYEDGLMAMYDWLVGHTDDDPRG